MDPRNAPLKSEIAAAAARFVVEDGMEYGPAKRQAAKVLGLPARTALPSNEDVEDAVFEHIAIFCADSQAAELQVLRRLALRWMERLADFRPHLAASVWRGTATRRSGIQIELFCDDCKSAEIRLIDLHVPYEPGVVAGMRGEHVDALRIFDACAAFNEVVAVDLLVYDHDDLRGALRADSRGRTGRGDLAAVRQLVAAADPEAS